MNDHQAVPQPVMDRWVIATRTIAPMCGISLSSVPRVRLIRFASLQRKPALNCFARAQDGRELNLSACAQRDCLETPQVLHPRICSHFADNTARNDNPIVLASVTNIVPASVPIGIQYHDNQMRHTACSPSKLDLIVAQAATS
ncbi:hypothetical protein MRB53_040211 [Persea americana]|nr:hypothetical protein MRB53_040211 [Persea americana]